MKHRIAVAVAVATAAALGGTGAFVVPAASAPKTRILTFTSVQEAQLNFSKAVFIQQDKDVNKADQILGYDLLYLVFNPRSETAKLTITVDRNGGFLYGVASAGANPVIHGTVTGGTGIVKGAAGTILAKNLNKAAVTITYHT